MSSKLDICNLALGMVNAMPIGSLTEVSAEAITVNMAYAMILRAVLEPHPWGFATKLQSLAALDGEELGEFSYVYELPADCLTPQGTIHGLDEQPEFKVRGRKFYSDENPVMLEYTYLEENTGVYSPTFVTALATSIAAYVAPRLGANKMQSFLLQQSIAALRTAKASDAKLTNKKSTANRTFVSVRS